MCASVRRVILEDSRSLAGWVGGQRGRYASAQRRPHDLTGLFRPGFVLSIPFAF